MDNTDNTNEKSPKARYGKVDENNRLTADEMDEQRRENDAYEYLCHLQESKDWIEACINEPLPSATEIEENMQNGVFLAKLAHFIAPDQIKLKKIFDLDLSRYESSGLHFRHTDNINHWLRSMHIVGMPLIFHPETTDIYDRKNIPRAIYCIHALSLYLFKLGKAPKMQNLFGKIQFTEEEICAMKRELDKYGIQMPAFSKIGGILANEMPVDEVALHAAVIAINSAIDRQVAEDTVTALRIDAAHLVNVSDSLSDRYQSTLFEAKREKLQSALEKSHGDFDSFVPDVYDELLTQAELQGYVNRTNIYQILEKLHESLNDKDIDELSSHLKAPQLLIRDINESNMEEYMLALTTNWQNKKNTRSPEDTDEDVMLTKSEVGFAVAQVNEDCEKSAQLFRAVNAFNRSLSLEDPQVTIKALHDPLIGLQSMPEFASKLFHTEFRNIKVKNNRDLSLDEIISGSIVLKSCADINEAIELNNCSKMLQLLLEDTSFLEQVLPENADKYMQEFREEKETKRQNKDDDMLTHGHIQGTIYHINIKVQQDNDRIQAVQNINIAIDNGIASETFKALSASEASIDDLDERQCMHYHALLEKYKKHKAKESGDAEAQLWYEEIDNTIFIANEQTRDALKMTKIVKEINCLLEQRCLLAAASADISAGASTTTSDNLGKNAGESTSTNPVGDLKQPAGTTNGQLTNGHDGVYNETGEKQETERELLETDSLVQEDVCKPDNEDKEDEDEKKEEEEDVSINQLETDYPSSPLTPLSIDPPSDQSSPTFSLASSPASPSSSPRSPLSTAGMKSPPTSPSQSSPLCSPDCKADFTATSASREQNDGNNNTTTTIFIFILIYDCIHTTFCD